MHRSERGGGLIDEDLHPRCLSRGEEPERGVNEERAQEHAEAETSSGRSKRCGQADEDAAEHHGHHADAAQAISPGQR